MNNLIKILFFVLIVVSCDTNDRLKYKNPELSTEERVADLLGRMTLEEKIRQMDMYSAHDLIEEGRLSVEKAEKIIDGLGIGSVRDFYPESAEYSNELQKFIIENNRLGIPALIIEEALHGYLGKGSTSFPVPIGLGSMWDVETM